MFTYDHEVAIIGATGKLGRLLAASLSAEGVPLRLIGRNEISLKALSAELTAALTGKATVKASVEAKPNTDYRIITALGDLPSALVGVHTVVNTVGPFTETADIVARAALAAGAHYVDISNEYNAAEKVIALDSEARRLGLSLLPSAGFGTVASTGLAMMLLEGDEHPDTIEMGIFTGDSENSSGVLASILHTIASGGARLESGKYRRAPLGSTARRVDTYSGTQTIIDMGLADLALAPQALKARRISVSVPVPLPPLLARVILPIASLSMRSERLRNRVVGRATSHEIANRRATQPEMIDVTARSWARITYSNGRVAEAWLEAADGYEFTTAVASATVMNLLSGQAPSGVISPASQNDRTFLKTLISTRIPSARITKRNEKP